MSGVTAEDSLSRDVVEVILDLLGDEVDDGLYLLAGGEIGVFVDADGLDRCLREDDLADVDVDLLIFKYFNVVDPSLYPHVLEHVDRQVYDLLRVRVKALLLLRH